MHAPLEPSLVHALRPHRGEVTCLDMCAAKLATGGGDRALRLWRWAPGAGWEEAAVAKGAHRFGVTAARWAPGGSLLASAGVDGAARLWCGRTLAARRALVAPGAPAVRALCWAGAGGARLLAGHDDGALCVWHVGRGALLARMAAHEGALHALCAPAGGALAVSVCTHGVLKVFDLADVCEGGRAPLAWEDNVHDLGALCADASEDGAALATGGHDSRIRVWRVAGHAEVAPWGAPLEGHAAAVTALRWAGAGARLLASASLDRSARLWEPAAGACLRVVAAHARYLTCVALDGDSRCMITGSNDKSVRTWSLGDFGLGDALDPPCVVDSHFAVGDLQGIGPVEGEEPFAEPAEGAAYEGGGEGSGEARRVWHEERAHAGAINCIAAQGEVLATASSDGAVRLWRWCEAAQRPVPEHALEAHQYPVLAADLGAGARLLLTAGLDGGAYLWDVQSGVQLRALCVPAGGGEAGGGGVRGARVSPHRPPLLLLATDDGLAPLWSLASQDPRPEHVFSGHAEAATCCAWAGDGRVAATGSAGGELRVLAPPPLAAILQHLSTAHDLGVLSCDFTPRPDAVGLPAGCHLLATTGCDSLLKLWVVDVGSTEGPVERASIRVAGQVEAHGGSVSCVRWAPGGALLATAGDDGWARVWRVARAGEEATLLAGVPAGGPGGSLSVALLPASLLAVGGNGGELTLWRLPPRPGDAAGDEEEDAEPRFWGEAGVVRWLREYVSQAPGSPVSREEGARLEASARRAGLGGARLLDDPLDELLDAFGYGPGAGGAGGAGGAEAGAEAQLRRELRWLRRAPPTAAQRAAAPHRLLCPLTHRLLREPARAADGFSYERAAFAEWLLASDAAISPLTGRRLRNARLLPNYALRDELRSFLGDADADEDDVAATVSQD